MTEDTLKLYRRLKAELSDWVDRFHGLYTTTLFSDQKHLIHSHSALYLAYAILCDELHRHEMDLIAMDQMDRLTEEEYGRVPLQAVPDGATGQQ